MSDELSIRHNQKKKSEQEGVKNHSYDAAVDDVGEASWEVAEKEKPVADESQGFPGFGGEEEEEKAKPSSFDIGRLISGIKARFKILLLIIVCFAVLGFAFASTKNSYKWVTSTTIILHQHQNVFKLAKSKGFKIQKYKKETFLATVTLPSVLQGAAEKAGLDISGGAVGGSLEVQSEGGEKHRLITLVITWKDPQQAADLANGLVESLADKNQELRKADALASLDFYGRKLVVEKERLAKSELGIIAFKKKLAIVDIDSGTETRLQALATLYERHRNILADMDGIVASKELAQSKLKVLEDFVVNGVTYSNPLHDRLNTLELALGDAKGKYTDINPKIIEMKEAIKKVKMMIATGKYDVEANTYASNPLKTTLSERINTLDEDYKISTIKEEALRNMIAEMKGDIKHLNEHSAKFYQMIAQHDEIKTLEGKLKERVAELKLVINSEETDFDVVEKAQVPKSHLPNKKKSIQMMGIIGGVIVGLLVAVILELRDPSLRTVKEAAGLFPETEFLYELQEVPPSEKKIIDTMYPKDKVTALFRRMLNDFCAQVENETRQTLAFISVEREAGRSTVLANYAQSLALKEEPVLLVDADFAMGAGRSASDFLGVSRVGSGILGVLSGETARFSDVMQQTKTKAVRAVSARGTRRSSEDDVFWLARKRMKSLVEQLRNYRGNVLYDLSPLQDNESAFEAAAVIGHAVFVVRSGHSKKSEVKELAERLETAGVKVHAVFITDVPERFLRNGVQYKKVKGRSHA